MIPINRRITFQSRVILDSTPKIGKLFAISQASEYLESGMPNEPLAIIEDSITNELLAVSINAYNIRFTDTGQEI